MSGMLLRRRGLASNVGALYALQIANYLIPLATLPWLVRQLGAEQYGHVAFAYALTYFLVLFVDAGFNTRAARTLASRGDSREAASAVFAATQWIRAGSVLVCLGVLAGLVATVPMLRADPLLYFASFMTVVGSWCFPTWLFQGLEIMHFTTVCSVAGRLIVTMAIFACVNGPEDSVLAAFLQCSATFVSGLLATPLLYRRLGLSLLPPAASLRAELRLAWREGRGLAVSEYLANALSNAGVFVLGLFEPKAAVGRFAAVEKLGRAGATSFNPLLQALFPRLVGLWQQRPEQARREARRWTLVLTALALSGTLGLLLLAEWLLPLLFGQGWDAQATLMRIFSLWFFFNVTNAISGQLWLLAAGHQQAYARCIFIEAVVQAMVIVPSTAWAGATGTAVALAATELVGSALLWRAVRVRHGRHA